MVLIEKIGYIWHVLHWSLRAGPSLLSEITDCWLQESVDSAVKIMKYKKHAHSVSLIDWRKCNSIDLTLNTNDGNKTD